MNNKLTWLVLLIGLLSIVISLWISYMRDQKEEMVRIMYSNTSARAKRIAYLIAQGNKVCDSAGSTITVIGSKEMVFEPKIDIPSYDLFAERRSVESCRQSITLEGGGDLPQNVTISGCWEDLKILQYERVFVVISAGPDGDYDYEKIIQFNGHGVSEHYSISEAFEQIMYNPTNGILSDGDIVGIAECDDSFGGKR